MVLAADLHKELENTVRKLKRQLKDLQNTCPHSEVLHYSGSHVNTTLHPIRLCKTCGFEEEGGWWCYALDCSHWHAKDKYDQKILAKKSGRNIESATSQMLAHHRELCRI